MDSPPASAFEPVIKLPSLLSSASSTSKISTISPSKITAILSLKDKISLNSAETNKTAAPFPVNQSPLLNHVFVYLQEYELHLLF